MGASGQGQFFQFPLGSSAPPADGPARVVKGESSAKPAADWKGVPVGHAMRGFSLRAFGGGKTPATNEDEKKFAELRTALHKSEEARRKAVEEAKDEMVQMAKAALAEGTEKGRVEGEREAWAKYQAQLAVLQKNTAAALNKIAEEKTEAFLAFEKMVVELFSTALVRIVGTMPEWSDEVVLPMLRQSVAALNASTALTVRIHPADFTVAKEQKHFWQTLENAAADLRFEADPRIPRGGCLIEAGATSAAADPLTTAENMVEAIRSVYQARLDEARRNAAGGESKPEHASP